MRFLERSKFYGTYEKAVAFRYPGRAYAAQLRTGARPRSVGGGGPYVPTILSIRRNAAT